MSAGRASAQVILDLLKQLGGKGSLRDIKGISTLTSNQIHNCMYQRLEPAGCVTIVGQVRVASGNKAAVWAFVKDWDGPKAKKQPERACQKIEITPGRMIVKHGKGYVSTGGQGRR